MIIKPDDIKAVSALFDGWEETLVYSCLEGTMGEIYSTHDGLSAMAMINDFCFLSGAPSGELAAFRPENRGGFIIYHNGTAERRMGPDYKIRIRPPHGSAYPLCHKEKYRF